MDLNGRRPGKQYKDAFQLLVGLLRPPEPKLAGPPTTQAPVAFCKFWLASRYPRFFTNSETSIEVNKLSAGPKKEAVFICKTWRTRPKWPLTC